MTNSFVKGSYVRTPSGFLKIENIKINNRLLTNSSENKKVKNIIKKENYQGDLFILKIYSHYKNIKCTPNHKFLVNNRFYNNSEYCFEKPFWLEASQLNENHYIGMVNNTKSIIPTINNLKLDSKEIWYYLGLFLKQNNTDMGKRMVIKNTKFFELYKIASNLYNDLLEWVFDSPKEFITEFLNGMKDIESLIFTKSYSFALSIQRLYLKVRIISEIIKDKNLFIVKIIKKQVAFFDDKYIWFKIKKMSYKSDNVCMYDFEVNDDNSYVVENSLVKGFI